MGFKREMAEKASASSSQTLPARAKTAAAAPGLKRKESDDFDDYFVSWCWGA